VFTVAQRVAAGGFAAAALVGAAAVCAGQTGPSTWLNIAVGTLLPAAAIWQLDVQRRKLLFVDYVHLERYNLCINGLCRCWYCTRGFTQIEFTQAQAPDKKHLSGVQHRDHNFFAKRWSAGAFLLQ